ncbi:MAG: hypothetical protein R3B40_04095 [Polyangiales bacterium]
MTWLRRSRSAAFLLGCAWLSGCYAAHEGDTLGADVGVVVADAGAWDSPDAAAADQARPEPADGGTGGAPVVTPDTLYDLAAGLVRAQLLYSDGQCGCGSWAEDCRTGREPPRRPRATGCVAAIQTDDAADLAEWLEESARLYIIVGACLAANDTCSISSHVVCPEETRAHEWVWFRNRSYLDQYNSCVRQFL